MTDTREVPVIPTDEMLLAAKECCPTRKDAPDFRAIARSIYTCMLAAAPTAPVVDDIERCAVTPADNVALLALIGATLRATHDMLDDSEELGDNVTHVDTSHVDNVCSLFVQMDEQFPERPGYVSSPCSNLIYALERALSRQPAQAVVSGHDVNKLDPEILAAANSAFNKCLLDQAKPAQAESQDQRLARQYAGNLRERMHVCEEAEYPLLQSISALLERFADTAQADAEPVAPDSEYVMRLEKLNDQLIAQLKELDPDPVVCGCHEANCEHSPIAKLPRQALVDHYKRMLKLAREEAAQPKYALRSALELWDAFIVEVNKDAGIDCKNFLGSVTKYKEIFLNAARAAGGSE